MDPFRTLSCGMCLKPCLGLLLAALFVVAVPQAMAHGGDPQPPPDLSLAQIVSRIQSQNQAQEKLLKPYRALRTYNVIYHGLGTLSARMQVEVSYDPAYGKKFQIVSQSGPVLLRDAVLKRAVTSEEEASKDKGATALSPANYTFTLEGKSTVDGRPVYVLSVDPLKPEKFLYRGTIWVDSADFGVVKIQAAPAKNPSIWISRAEIWVTNELTDGFWLPQQTRSETRVRLGGTAELTIDYGHYEFETSRASAAQVRTPAKAGQSR
jgi:hypothetical protein